VPIILTSDETHLTNFSGDKKAWPIYLTLGNFKSAFRNKPSSFATVLLAVLPVPPKTGVISAADEKQFKETKARILHEVLGIILRPIRDAYDGGKPLQYTDGQVCNCYPILAAWLADHMEYAKLFNIKTHLCPVCQISADQLDSTNQQRHPPRDYVEYRQQYRMLHGNGLPQHREMAR
jgi:hypothetical protein